MTLKELKELCDKEIEKGNAECDVWVNTYDDEGDRATYVLLQKGFTKNYGENVFLG